MEFLEYKLLYREEDFERLLEREIRPEESVIEVIGFLDIFERDAYLELVKATYKKVILARYIGTHKIEEVLWVEYNYSHKFEQAFKENI